MTYNVQKYDKQSQFQSKEIRFTNAETRQGDFSTTADNDSRLLSRDISPNNVHQLRHNLSTIDSCQFIKSLRSFIYSIRNIFLLLE